MSNRVYKWWLYHGPGFKKVRRALRINDEVLPPDFTEVRDSHFEGEQALEAAHEVEKLREQLPPDYYREFPSGTTGSRGKEKIAVTVAPVIHDWDPKAGPWGA